MLFYKKRQKTRTIYDHPYVNVLPALRDVSGTQNVYNI